MLTKYVIITWHADNNKTRYHCITRRQYFNFNYHRITHGYVYREYLILTKHVDHHMTRGQLHLTNISLYDTWTTFNKMYYHCMTRGQCSRTIFNLNITKYTIIVWFANDSIHRQSFSFNKTTIIVWFADNFVYGQHFDFNKTCYYRKLSKDRFPFLRFYMFNCFKMEVPSFGGSIFFTVSYDSRTILSQDIAY
jgi:hypothetical protein